MQIGQDRSGLYSYTPLENLFGCEMPKVEALKPEWKPRTQGETVWFCAPQRFNGQGYMVAAVVEPQESVCDGFGSGLVYAAERRPQFGRQLGLHPRTHRCESYAAVGTFAGRHAANFGWAHCGRHILGSRSLCDGAKDAEDHQAPGGNPIVACEAKLRIHHLAVALHDAADVVELFARALEQCLRLLEFLRIHNQQHAQAHVKSAQHFVGRNIA